MLHITDIPCYQREIVLHGLRGEQGIDYRWRVTSLTLGAIAERTPDEHRLFIYADDPTLESSPQCGQLFFDTQA